VQAALLLQRFEKFRVRLLAMSISYSPPEGV
jgi:hypothetical protein